MIPDHRMINWMIYAFYEIEKGGGRVYKEKIARLVKGCST
jgi:hypothetical protein